MLKRLLHSGLIVGIGIVSLGIGTADAGGTPRVALSPTPLTLNEGSSQLITVSLDEPIVSNNSDPAYVTLALTTSDSTKTSLSTNTLNFTGSDWYAPQTFTLNTVDDGVYNDGETVTITATATSNAPYYNTFVETLPVTVANIDPAPPVVSVPSVSDQTAVAAPNTGLGAPLGQSPLVPLAVATLPLAVGAVVSNLRRQRKVNRT
jgi:hypothetical protein